MTTAHEVQIHAQRIIEANKHLLVSGVLSHSGLANLSARLDADRFLLTTTGYVRELRPDQVATVGLDGKVLDGELAPENAEIIAMHSVVYNARIDVGAVIHTHSPAATAFALAHRPLPCRFEPLLRFGQAEDVPVAAWGPRGSGMSARNIAEALGRHPATTAVLLANHGLLAFGPDPLATARLLVAIEESAEAELAATRIGGAVDFPEGSLAAVRESMARVSSTSVL
ncbi:MAG: class II aldolase [Mycobacterium sp.]|nr:MAG: class II aldolase [Mycobacterium sp.]